MLIARILILTLLGASTFDANERVPAVVAGPELAATARVVEAPIDEVMVFSDRARVRRRATLNIDKGLHTLRLPDLPGSVWMDAVRVQADGAKVIRVEMEPIDRERFSIEQVDALLVQLETLRDRLAENYRFGSALQAELDLLDQAAPLPPVVEHERDGKPAPVAPAEWTRVLDFMDARRARAHADMLQLEQDRDRLQREADKVRRDLEARDLGAWTKETLQVAAILEAAASGKVQLELEYFLPGAQWLPSYDLAYDPATRKVQLYTAGLVQQSTGEDWTNVALHLSTAIPGQGIDMPELLTWTLGEQQDFQPQPRARRAPPEAPRYAAPEPVAASDAEALARAEIAERRLAALRQLASADLGAAGASDALKFIASSGSYGVGDTMGGLATSGGRPRVAAPRKQPMAPPPAPEPTPADTAGAYAEAPTEVAAEDEPRVMAAAPMSMAKADRAPGGRRESSRRMSLGLEEEQWASPRLAGHLPAMLAGGLDYIYIAPVRTSIPSTGEPLRVPLRTDSYPVKAFYEATPALKETAFLRADVTNQSDVPILRGSVNIFVGGDFAGQGELPTTGAGGNLHLPLGADEDVRLTRRVVPTTVKEGVIGKEEVTTYKVTLEVANHKRDTIRIRVNDQIPVSRHEDVKLALDEAKPTPSDGPGKTGHVMWEIDVAPGKVQAITFNYTLRRPADFRLRQE